MPANAFARLVTIRTDPALWSDLADGLQTMWSGKLSADFLGSDRARPAAVVALRPLGAQRARPAPKLDRRSVFHVWAAADLVSRDVALPLMKYWLRRR